MSEEIAGELNVVPPLIGHGKAVEERIRRLQNTHRLAIHCFEEPDYSRLYPIQTISDLEKNPADEIPELLRTGRPALFSLTLLPTQKSRKALIPYGNALRPTYLFDLSVEYPSPARVVRTFRVDGYTGDNRFSKDFKLHRETGIPYLDSLYRQYRHPSLLQNAVAEDATLSEKQLDALGQYYESMDASQVTTLVNNELLAAVSKEHIAAIALPITRPLPTDKNSSVVDYTFIKLNAQLAGALAGLEHARKGMVLPVVYYHVIPPQQGQCTYVAQGIEECEAVAKDAIHKLQQYPLFNAIINGKTSDMRTGTDIIWLKKHTQDLLGIDISQPLTERDRIVVR